MRLMSRRLDDLSPRFRPLAFELLARCVEQGIAVMIVDTLRTPEEQAANIAKGVSWTKNSKHLTGDAIDICPYLQWDLHGPDKLNWDGSDPVWAKLAAIGRALGLTVGADWRVKDLGHFEFKEPSNVRRA
jgi:peptidoglycan L-alanyl-D-glutamate endopeptidase CwlK